MEPFKNELNPAAIKAAGGHLARHSSDFDREAFEAQASAGLEALELKARVAHIARALADHLPDDWPQAVRLIQASLATPSDPEAPTVPAPTVPAPERDGLAGWIVWAVGDVAVVRGLDDPETSLDLLEAVTQRWSAEFAIRHFLVAHPDVTLRRLRSWLEHPSAHVRRLVSEGTRPRLPWGIQLRAFVADPSPTLPLLEALKDDESEYVRRSVANHLGDIAKDHADLAVTTGARWLQGADRNRERLVRHGLRWLLKRGHAGALAALGYGPVDVNATLTGTPESITMPGHLELRAEITSNMPRPAHLMIDYLVERVGKPLGKSKRPPARNVFKWTTRELGSKQSVRVRKRHRLVPVSTRRYVAGRHRVTLQVNGQPETSWAFDLHLPPSDPKR